MAKFMDLTGNKYGYWTVLRRVSNNQRGSARWLCECECGKQRILTTSALSKGYSRSCGCHKNDYNRTHGGKGTRLYEIWRHMRYRCENPNNQAYEHYGARGITVCNEWHDFASFRKWAEANGYDDSKSIDRIDVNGNYTPDNCRWVDSKTQMNNRRNTPHYEYNGQTLTISEWSQKLGIPRSTILNRLKRGWEFERAILTPVQNTGVKSNQNSNKEEK